MANSADRLRELREILTQLTEDDNALVRTAVRLALSELDRGDLEAVIETIEGVLNPD